MKVLKGFCYCITAATETTITDDNGLIFTVKAGEQGYFVASSDEVSVTGTCTIVQVRGNFNVPTTTGGGGGQTFPEGAIVGIGPDGDYASIGEYITYGGSMFSNNQNITKWYGDMPNLTVAYGGCTSTYNYGMFQGSSNLTIFKGDMPHLVSGENYMRMFKNCTSLESFEGSLSGIQTYPSNMGWGDGIFNGCTSLRHFKSDLSKIGNDGRSLDAWFGTLLGYARIDSIGEEGPVVCLLETWDADLSMATNGRYAFINPDNGYTVSNLRSFKGDLGNLQDAERMFADQCIHLTNFETTSLHSLVDAKEMFKGCKLSKASVENIIDVIRDWSDEPACCIQDHTITIGVDATEVSISDINNVYMPELTAKAWTVTWERN